MAAVWQYESLRSRLDSSREQAKAENQLKVSLHFKEHLNTLQKAMYIFTEPEVNNSFIYTTRERSIKINKITLFARISMFLLARRDDHHTDD